MVAAVAVDFAIAFVYISVHTLILLIQSVALNVAVNSNNNVLLTLLVSNNFVELKGSVFKKCEKQNLFQISAAAAAAAAQFGAQFWRAIQSYRPPFPPQVRADAVERFQMFIYLLMALQVVQTGKPLGDLAYAIGMIAAMEVMVDWLKHAFVVKFNFIPPDIYAKFTTALCVDLAEPRGRRRGDSGHAMAIAARIGFVPIPLLCLLVKVLGTDVYGMTNLRHPSGWALCVLAWLCMCGPPRFPPSRPPDAADPPPNPPRPRASGARSRCSRRSCSSALRRSAPRNAAAADSSPRMGSYNGPADFLMGVDRYTLVGKRIA